jgi:hypothetical protein
MKQRMHQKISPERDRLIDVLGAANGFTLPLRVGQKMAIEQIYQREMDAILDDGWEPTGLRPQLEASQAALTDLQAQHRALLDRLDTLEAKWEGHGYGVQAGTGYAKELRAARDQ